MADTPNYSYEEVRQQYADWQAKNPDAKMDLPEFAQRMDMMDASPARQSAYNDNIAKRVNYGIDQALSPVSDAIAPAGAAIDRGIGAIAPSYQGHAAEDAIRGTPRALAEFGGFMIPGVGEAEAVPLAARALQAAGMASSGVSTYAKTDSIPAALIGAASLPITHGLTGVGENVAANLATRGAADAATAEGSAAVSPIKDALTNFIGGTAGAVTAQEGTRQAESLVQGQGLQNPLTADNLIGTAAGALPGVVGAGLHALRGGTPEAVAAARGNALAPVMADLKAQDDAAQARQSVVAEPAVQAQDQQVASIHDFISSGGETAPQNVAEVLPQGDAIGRTADQDHQVLGNPNTFGAADSTAEGVAKAMTQYTQGAPVTDQPVQLNLDHPAMTAVPSNLNEIAPEIKDTFAKSIQPAEPTPGEPPAVQDEPTDAQALKLSLMKPEDVNTVPVLTSFVKDVNETLAKRQRCCQQRSATQPE